MDTHLPPYRAFLNAWTMRWWSVAACQMFSFVQSWLAGVEVLKKRCSTFSWLPSTSRVGSDVNAPPTPPYPVVCRTVGRSKSRCQNVMRCSNFSPFGFL